jgi:hypothetical protein
LKPDSINLNRLQEIDMKKVEALKKAVSEGTYTVPAEDLAPKLMESMFQNTILDANIFGGQIGVGADRQRTFWTPRLVLNG